MKAESGKYRVFLPSLRTNASGASWANGSTPGTSLPMSQFYVVKEGDTASSINAALAGGRNLLFTPGIYHVNQTLNVTRPNTVVLGNYMGTITHVINDVGAVTPPGTVPVNVIDYP